MLHYIPLESYESRYTMQWSAAKTGWLESKWRAHDVEYQRIEGEDKGSQTIETGSVLDGPRRATWGFSQTEKIISRMKSGEIKNEDVLFFDDFFHPGLEMVAYNAALMGVKINSYAFCHAQSVDIYDFTHLMKSWMRPLEESFIKIYAGVFVNNDLLKVLCENGWNTRKIHNCGHVFDSQEVHSRMPHRHEYNNEVLFTSRFDKEKQPHLFMDLVEHTFKEEESTKPNDPARFRICTSTPELKSTDTRAVLRARKLAKRFPGRFTISEGLTKEQYYAYLRSASVQISTSEQDWISFTLLETTTAGCYPLYPNFRSFPEAFGNMEPHLYTPWDLTDMYGRLRDYLNLSYMEKNTLSKKMYQSITIRHNDTWKRQLDVMKVPHAKSS